MKNFTELAIVFIVWCLFAVAGLCIILLIVFMGDALLNGVNTVPACEVTQ